MTTVLIISMATFTGCGDKATDKIGFGTLENGTYRNEFFDMTVKLPNDWSAIDNEARKKMKQASSKMTKGQDENL